MNHREGFIESITDSRLYHQAWLPEGAPRACIVLVHGLAEHSGRYTRLIEQLVPQNYAIFGLDHVGHGKSEGTRVFVRAFSEFTSALETFIAHVHDSYPQLPLFLYAHSVGALIAANTLLDYDIDVAGSIFSGPCVKVPTSVSAATVTMAKILSRLAPKLGISAVDARGVSRDPDEVRAYIDDPLVYSGKTTARLACELLKAMRRVHTEAVQITVPALILQGGCDSIVDPDGAVMLYDAIGSRDKTLKVYDGLYHEIHNEPEHQRVLSDVAAWLEEQRRT